MAETQLQLWRVFSPATRETMPWCSTWESLASGSLSCYLLNEIRAPEPGLDPFTGLDIPPIPHIAQPNSLLLALPPELLYAITDHLTEIRDIISLSLTCNPFLSVCLRKLRVSLHDRMKGAWINKPLICLGSLTSVNADLPPPIQPIERALKHPSTPIASAYRLTYRSGSRGDTFFRFETTHTLLKNYDRFDDKDDRINQFLSLSPQIPKTSFTNYILESLTRTTPKLPRLPNWTHRLIDRAIQLDNGTLRLYSPTANYVIRNLSKKQYLPFSAAQIIKGEIESVFFKSQTIPLDQVVTIIFLFLISWSSSTVGLEDEMVRSNATGVYGLWAGDNFDVCEIEKIDKQEWSSVEDRTLLSLRLYLPRMYRNMHGQDRWGEPHPPRRSGLETSWSSWDHSSHSFPW
ncbi:hypothetical protein TWF281_004754 [Arthrobotrys megalospora]